MSRDTPPFPRTYWDQRYDDPATTRKTLEPTTAAGRALLDAFQIPNGHEWRVVAIEAEARAAALDEARAAVEALPQGERSRRHTYLDEEGNRRTDYDRPATVSNDGRVSLSAALDAIAALREGADKT